MKTMNDYLIEYGVSHQNKMNQMIHKICVPLIMFSILLMLDSITFYFPLSFILLVFALVYYLKIKISLKLLIFIVIQTAIFELINFNILMPLKLYLGLGIFTISWIFQFIGHHVEGKRPSFLKDLFFLLIGPVWVWHHLTSK